MFPWIGPCSSPAWNQAPVTETVLWTSPNFSPSGSWQYWTTDLTHRLADEKRKSDEKLEALRKDHEEIMKVMQANHEKEKIEQHRRMLDQIQQLREELQSMSQRQVYSQTLDFFKLTWFDVSFPIALMQKDVFLRFFFILLSSVWL